MEGKGWGRRHRERGRVTCPKSSSRRLSEPAIIFGSPVYQSHVWLSYSHLYAALLLLPEKLAHGLENLLNSKVFFDRNNLHSHCSRNRKKHLESEIMPSPLGIVLKFKVVWNPQNTYSRLISDFVINKTLGPGLLKWLVRFANLSCDPESTFEQKWANLWFCINNTKNEMYHFALFFYLAD